VARRRVTGAQAQPRAAPERRLRTGSIVGGMSPSDTLVLPPGAISARRRAYVMFLVLALVVSVVLQGGYLLWLPHSDAKAGATTLVGNMLTTLSLLLLSAGVLAGLLAIRRPGIYRPGIYRPGLRVARRVAQAGVVVGIVGALLALLLGVLQGVAPDALVVGTCSLIAGVLNEVARRLAVRAAAPAA